MSDVNSREYESPKEQNMNSSPESTGDAPSKERPSYGRGNDSQSEYGDSSGQRRETRGRMLRSGRPFYRKKYCKFCAHKGDGVVVIDHKKIDILRRYTTERGKILPRRINGNCAKCQRKLAIAVKRARALALLPFSA